MSTLEGFLTPLTPVNPYPYPGITTTHTAGKGFGKMRVKVGPNRPQGYPCPSLFTSDVRARAWPKAQAWAGLEWAQACKNPEPGPKPELGLGWAGLGLEPGLFAYHGIMNKYDK